MDKVYVGIKDNLVVNTMIIDDENLSLIEIIKNEFNFDHLIQCDNNQVLIGWSFDGEKVYDPNYVEPEIIEYTDEPVIIEN
jgi:hypothetical protein